MKRAAWWALATVLLGLPLVPIPRWVGAPDPGPEWGVHLQAWAIGAIVVVVGALLAGRVATRLPRWQLRWSRARERQLVGALAAGLFAAGVIAGWWAFAGNPHLVDEMAQLFQARAFTTGRVAAPAPALPEFFVLTHTWITDAGWVSQYPPAHSAMLAAGMLVRAEWLVNPLLSAATLLFVYVLAKGLYGPRTGVVAAVLWATSGWVIAMSGTYMNHASATAFAAAAWASVWAPGRPGRARWILAGAFLGCVGLTRPLDAIAAAAPIGVWLLAGRRAKPLAWMALGAAPLGVAFGYLNWRLYGDPLQLGYSLVYGPDVRLGFHVDPWGNAFTPAVALSNLTAAVRRLHIYVFEWPVPALLLVGIWALAARHRRVADTVVAVGILAAPALYFFYWHSGFHPGPRFYYIAAPFLVIGTARAVHWLWRLARRPAQTLVRFDTAVTAGMMIVILWSVVALIPARLRSYHDDLPSLKLHPERALRERGVQQALVLIPESWGARIIVGLWGLGVQPAKVEQVYRGVDACDLYNLVDRARSAGWNPDRTTRGLDSLLRATPVVPELVPDWPDPTLRLRAAPGTLPLACRVELRRDLQGFTLYGSQGWRNAPGLDQGIVFARDLYERNATLLERYTGWEVWRYAPPRGHPEAPPVLTRLSGPSSERAD